MEDTNGLKGKGRIVKIIIAILLIIAILMQIRITYMIYAKTSALDADPLAYGAKLFGIYDCTCPINDFTTIYFNQTGSKYIIKQKLME